MHDAPQAGEVVSTLHVVRQLQQAMEHRRHPVRVRDPMAVDQTQGLFRIETPHQHGTDAGDERPDAVDPQGGRMVGRSSAEIHVEPGAVPVEAADSRYHGLAVAAVDTLGPPGRAGRIQHLRAGGQIVNVVSGRDRARMTSSPASSPPTEPLQRVCRSLAEAGIGNEDPTMSAISSLFR
jgi:hypothetical protein